MRLFLPLSATSDTLPNIWAIHLNGGGIKLTGIQLIVADFLVEVLNAERKRSINAIFLSVEFDFSEDGVSRILSEDQSQRTKWRIFDSFSHPSITVFLHCAAHGILSSLRAYLVFTASLKYSPTLRKSHPISLTRPSSHSHPATSNLLPAWSLCRSVTQEDS